MAGGIFDLRCCMLDFSFFFLIAACGIQFPDQGSNWAPCLGSAESQPLDHQRSPERDFKVQHEWLVEQALPST